MGHNFKIKRVNSAIEDRQNKHVNNIVIHNEISRGLTLTETIESLAKLTIALSG